jgi:hypothetical protein
MSGCMGRDSQKIVVKPFEMNKRTTSVEKITSTFEEPKESTFLQILGSYVPYRVQSRLLKNPINEPTVETAVGVVLFTGRFISFKHNLIKSKKISVVLRA